MNVRFALLALTLASVIGMSARAEDPAVPALPEGARARLGNGDLAIRLAASFALVPPDYNLVMLPDTPTRYRYFDLKAGKFSTENGPALELGGAILLSTDGTRMVLTPPAATTGPGIGRVLIVREAKTGKPIVECHVPKDFNPTTSAFPSVAFAGNGKILAQAGRTSEAKDANPEVIVWDLEKKDKDGNAAIVARVTPIRLSPKQPPAVHPVLSDDGKLLATRGNLLIATPKPDSPEDEARRTVQVWDVGTQKELFRARVSGNALRSVCEFSPDGSLLATGCGDSRIDLWDVKTGKLHSTLRGRTGQGWRLAFSPDGKTFAAVAIDGSIERWATADGKLIDTTPAPADLPRNTPHRLAFAPGGRVVAWGVSGSSVIVWEAPSGKYLTPAHQHLWSIQSLAFTDDGKHLITSGMDRRLLKWDANTGKPLGTVPMKLSRSVAPSQPSFTLSRDGKRGLTTGQPTVLYDLTTGEELFPIPRGTGYFHSFLSADGSRVITVTVPFDTKKTPNGTVTVWDVANRKKVAEIEVPFTNAIAPSAALSPSGNRLVLARFALSDDTRKQTLVVTGWDLKTGKKLGEAEDINTQGLVTVTAISEVTAIVSTTSGRVRAFDYEIGRGGDVVELTGRVITGPIVLSPDGKRYAYGVPTKDPTVYGVRIHEWPSGKALHTFAGHRGPVSALGFSADGKTLASGSHDTTVLLWDLTTIPAPK